MPVWASVAENSGDEKWVGRGKDWDWWRKEQGSVSGQSCGRGSLQVWSCSVVLVTLRKTVVMDTAVQRFGLWHRAPQWATVTLLASLWLTFMSIPGDRELWWECLWGLCHYVASQEASGALLGLCSGPGSTGWGTTPLPNEFAWWIISACMYLEVCGATFHRLKLGMLLQWLKITNSNSQRAGNLWKCGGPAQMFQVLLYCFSVHRECCQY